MSGDEADAVLRQALGSKALDDALEHAMSRQEQTRLVEQADDYMERVDAEGKSILPFAERLNRFNAGRRFTDLARRIDDGSIYDDIIMHEAFLQSNLGEDIGLLVQLLDKVATDMDSTMNLTQPAARKMLETFRANGNPEVDMENPELNITLEGSYNPNFEEVAAADLAEFLEDVGPDNVQRILEATENQTIIEDLLLTRAAVEVSDNVFTYSYKPFYMLDWEKSRMGALLGDSHEDRKKAVEELIKKIGHIKKHKTSSGEKLQTMLAQAEEVLRAAMQDTDTAYARLDALRAKKVEFEAQLQTEVERQNAEKAKVQERERFLGGVNRAAAIEELEDFYEIDEVASYSADTEPGAGRRHRNKRRDGRKIINSVANEIRITRAEAKTYREELLAMGYDEEDIDMKKLALLVRLRSELGGKIYNSSSEKSRGYLVWVSEYQGQACAVAELPVYGTATRIWAGADGDRWQQILHGGNLNEMDSHQVIHSHERHAEGSSVYTAEDNERHIKKVGRRIDELAMGKKVVEIDSETDD